MIHMRRLFGGFCAVSLAAAIMFGVMWVQSYRTLDEWRYAWGSQHVHFIDCVSLSGGLEIYTFNTLRQGQAKSNIFHERLNLLPNESSDRTFLFHVGVNSSWPKSIVDWLFPYWLVIAILCIPTLTYLAIWHRKAIPGLCPQCGYDLRATPERCPECGKTFTVPAKS